MARGKKLNITGQRFGRITVIEFSHTDERSRSLWKCKCDCGKEFIGDGYNINRGNTSSCGCLKVEVFIKTRALTIKLSECKVKKIRELYATNQFFIEDLAKMFKVKNITIRNIVLNKTRIKDGEDN